MANEGVSVHQGWSPKAVLFDLDGTLIDTMQVFADVAARVMVKHHGLDMVIGRARYLATSGIPFFQQLEVIFPGDPRNALAAAEFEKEKVIATSRVVPSKDTLVALLRLRRHGVLVAVSSNNFQEQVDRFARRCPVELDLAMGFGESLAKGAKHFERALRVFGGCISDLLFVGDSLADAELARQAGVRFVARLGTFSQAQFAQAAPWAKSVSSLTELTDLILPTSLAPKREYQASEHP